MAKHSPYTSRRTLSVSSKKIPTAKSYGRSTSPRSHRDELRGVEHLRYGNPTFLTQDRVEQKFGIDLSRDPNYYGDECESVGDDVYELREWDYVQDEIQYELPLKTPEEFERDLVTQIRKYRNAINVMAASAIMWDDLMEDLEDDDHLREQFDKFQMLRKLKGGQL